MDKPEYNKPPLTLQEQAKLLISRKLTGISQIELQEILNHISYYRLSGYAFPYQDKQKNNLFIEKNAWSLIKSDYELDEKLRILLFESIGYIEIALRSQLVYQMSIKHGFNWYSDVSLFRDSQRFSSDYQDLLNNWDRACDLFVKHYKGKYDTSKNRPAWMIFETTTFGSLSRYFENIKIKNKGKNDICNYWHITNRKDYDTFYSWLKLINTVRNICAHHSRLFNRIFPYKANTLEYCDDDNFILNWESNTKLYAAICIVRNMLSICAAQFPFTAKLKDILQYASNKQLQAMGFPESWEEKFDTPPQSEITEDIEEEPQQQDSSN